MEKVLVGYGGLWTAGQEKDYPVFNRIKKKHPGRLARAVTVAIERVADDLPFKILFESDTEMMKRHIDYPYSLAVAITRDDVVNERFTAGTSEINKSIINVGMVIIIYQTVLD
ncbi:MAG TPA: hypothetical protein P5244_15530, partial [Syntrophales bacterium]|nr:hypothetical protein [Syntrophales bacterium]